MLALSGLFLAAAACLTLAILFPVSAQAPLGIGRALVAVAVVMAGLTWSLGRRMPRWVLLAEALVAVGLNSVLVAQAKTPVGAVLDAFAYGWVTLYVAVFFRAWALPFAGGSMVAFGVGLLAAGLPGMVAAWGVIAVTTVALAQVGAGVTAWLRRQADTDPLTGVANRAGLEQAIGAIARSRRRSETPIAVAALDLDGFKRVNDRHGHQAGDRLLVEAVDAWRALLRAGDVLARVGGDEFVLVMPGTRPDEAERAVDRLRQAHPVRFSSGVADWRSGETLAECLGRADARLYAAKSARLAAA